jgi:hypothetical protein
MNDFDLTVLEFIKESGATATLIQTVDGEYDPVQTSVAQTVTNITVEGILMDLTLRSNGLSVKYNTMIEAGDKEFLMRPPHKTNGWDIPVVISSASDRINIAGHLYQIVTLKELNPTGADPILVSLYLRR